MKKKRNLFCFRPETLYHNIGLTAISQIHIEVCLQAGLIFFAQKPHNVLDNPHNVRYNCIKVREEETKMAKAVATCKCATCGSEFEKITIKRNRREADSWETWAASYYDECDECRQKRLAAEREEESRKAAEDAAELNLPKLEGSEKQIAWAERIRMEFIQSADKEIQATAERPQSSRMLVSELESFKEWILRKTEASWWIDKRGAMWSMREVISLQYTYWKADMEAVAYAEPEEATTEIVEPEQKKSTTVCMVEATEKKVTVSSKYDPEMPPVVKAAGYKWNGSKWSREMNVRSGSAEDRAAEIANKLLCAGFPVEVRKDIRDRAVNGTYEPEHKRWISWVDSGLKITGDVDTKGIPGIRKGIAPVESYEAVEEFARLHDYRFTPGARREVDLYKSRLTKATPIPGREAEYNDTADTIKNMLDSSRDVLDDLKEED